MEHPALSPPIRRLLSDFLCLTSCTRVPCQLNWVARHGSLQRTPNQYANWAQNPSPQFPDVWGKKENHVGVKKKKSLVNKWLVMMSYIINNEFLRSSTTYLVAVCWTHRSRAFLAPPCRSDSGFLLTGELVVSVLLVELSREELLLDNAWSAGKLMVSSSI